MDSTRTVEPRTAGIVIAAVVIVVIVIALVAGGAGDDDAADVASPDTTTSAPDVTAPSAPAADGPQVPPIDCGALITVSEMEDALGVWERDEPPATTGFEGGEACTDQLADEPEFFIRIEPGAAADFLPGARLNGVGSEPVVGVGDGAAWFEGSGGDGVGILSVRQATPVGVLVYRVAVGRPDVDGAQRLEIATTLALGALPRFPEVEVEVPEPTVITFEKQPNDPSELGLVDNLLAKEQGGEWTRGEGLAATLGYLADEADADDVLRQGDVLDSSATGLVRLAREYATAGPDADTRAEVSRLLDELVVAAPELGAAVAGGDEESAIGGPPKGASRPVAFGVVAQDGIDCDQDWFGLGCWAERSSILLDEMYGTGTYVVYHPDVTGGAVAGWNSGHVTWAVDAMEAAAQRYEALGAPRNGMPLVEILFTPISNTDAFTDTLSVNADDVCFVNLATPLQSLSEKHYRQRIAAEMAYCLIERTFQEQMGAGLQANRWWYDALAIYLSGVVYDDANLEHVDLPGILASRELETTMLDRSATNWVFFEHMHGFGGTDGVFGLIEGLPPLAGYQGIGDLFHTFEQGLTDISIPDLGPGNVPYAPEARLVEISGPTVVIEETLPFGMYRMNASVPSGMTACVEYDFTGELFFSWRPDPPGGWTDLPDELTGESMYLVTATEPGAGFTMTATKVTEDECDDEDDDGSGDASCLLDLVCGPSGYFVLEFEVVTIN